MRKKGRKYKSKADVKKYSAMQDVFKDSAKNHEARKAKRLFWKDKDLDA